MAVIERDVESLLAVLRGALSIEGEERDALVVGIGRSKCRSATRLLLDVLDRESDPEQKKKILRALSDLSDPACVPAMVSILEDPKGDHHNAALVLASLNEPAAVAALRTALLRDEGWDHYAECLVATGDPSAVQAIAEAVCTLDCGWYKRECLLRQLSTFPSEQVVAAFVPWLALTDPVPRSRAARALEQWDPSLLDGYADEFYASDNDELRAVGISAVARRDDPHELASFETIALSEESTIVRCAAAKALGDIGSDEYLNSLVCLLSDSDMDVRCAAAIALGDFGGLGGIHLCAALGKERSTTVRSAIIKSIGMAGLIFMEEALISLMLHTGEGHWHFRTAATEAVRALGTGVGTQACVDILERQPPEDTELRRAALEAITVISPELAAPFALRCLTEEDGRLRGAAFRVLGSLGSAAHDVLKEGLREGPVESRLAVAMFLVSRGVAEARDWLLEYARSASELDDEVAVALLDSIQEDDKSWTTACLESAAQVADDEVVASALQALSVREDFCPDPKLLEFLDANTFPPLQVSAALALAASNEAHVREQLGRFVLNGSPCARAASALALLATVGPDIAR